MEGSDNNALVKQMAELKKAMERNSLMPKKKFFGQRDWQWLIINTKNLDAKYWGNNQRNVGKPIIKGDAYAALQEIGTNTKIIFRTMGKGVQKSTEQTRAKFESVAKVASGLASGFAAVQGATALLGNWENENLEKTFVKVQSAMAIAQGVGGMKGPNRRFQPSQNSFCWGYNNRC